MSIEIGELRGLDAHKEALAQVIAAQQGLEAEADGRPFKDDQRTQFEELVTQRTQLDAAITELQLRADQAAQAVAIGERHTEPVGVAAPTLIGLSKESKVPENVHDLAAYRQRVNSVDQLAQAYQDGAMTIVEKATFPAARKGTGVLATNDQIREHLEELLDRHAGEDYGWVARRIIGTDDPTYREAWARYVSGGLGAVPPGRFMAALQTYTDASGGFAIPFTIDPTFILTTDGQVNPMRQIARVETITTKDWRPVTTGGVTAAYAAETAAAADGAPSDVASPAVAPIRAHVLVAMTHEYSEDYGTAAIAAEVGRLVRDAKDVLEATKFVMGSGSGEPQGIVAGIIAAAGSNIINSATVATYALVDVDALEGALGDRFISNAQFLAPRKIYQLTRAFGTAGQPANSIYDPLSGTLRGYPAKISNTMDKTTTTGSEPLLFGDFSHFVIVDRLGLSTEFVPQLFDASGNVLGRRGVYARWRNDSGILVQNAFRLLRIA